jgi:hypothetical protein
MRAFANATKTAPTAERCSCGTAGHSGEMCEECRKKEGLGLQPKLIVGAADDPCEREADAAARVVTAGSADAAADAPAARVSRRADLSAGRMRTAPASVSQAIEGRGEPLGRAERAFFEPRFGHDFSRVRVHRDAAAAASAGEIAARAFTVGNHVVFGAGRYAPETGSGRALIAHELAHVVQQTRGGATVVRRAIERQGNVTILIDYDDVVLVDPADRASKILGIVASMTGAPPNSAQESAVRALTAAAQHWLMFAMQLIKDNRKAAPTLNPEVAFDRLIDRAPNSAAVPLPDPDRVFVFEVLRVSGWSETAQAARLSRPSEKDRRAVERIVNPPSAGGGPTVGPLNEPELVRRLEPAVKHLLQQIDPALRGTVGTLSISAFQRIGDIVMEEARSFFSPFADAARGNIFFLEPPWHPSANIFSTNAQTPTQDLRMSYLLNRANMVGGATSTNARIIDANIYSDVNFDPRRADDHRALTDIVTRLEGDSTIQPIVDRLVQNTGRASRDIGTATRVDLSTEFDASVTSECAAHWQGIDTICHEILHALVHPRFAAKAATVREDQLIREGFTEVLGVQLFNDRVAPKAASDPVFKGQLESGVSGAPCPAPKAATIGYGDAGAGAEEIRLRVGDKNFRAAYFLGKPELAGIP